MGYLITLFAGVYGIYIGIRIMLEHKGVIKSKDKISTDGQYRWRKIEKIYAPIIILAGIGAVIFSLLYLFVPGF